MAVRVKPARVALAVAVACATLLGACESGTYVLVTVDANPTLQDIEYLECVAKHDASSSGIIHIPFREKIGTTTLPPKQTVALQFNDNTHGRVELADPYSDR